jgi:general secretion pathway protein E
MGSNASEVERLKDVASCLERTGYKTSVKETVRGKSGASYEVDVVAKKAELPLERILLIKCKLAEKTEILRVDEVTSFWAQIFDVGADRGMIVTTARVSEDAEVFANFHRIPIIYGRDEEELKNKLLVEWCTNLQ